MVNAFERKESWLIHLSGRHVEADGVELIRLRKRCRGDGNLCSVGELLTVKSMSSTSLHRFSSQSKGVH